MHINDNTSFKGYTIVSCGTLSPELNYLSETGFLNADKILYTKPGLHEDPEELEKQLVKQLETAKKYSKKVIVAYGSRCYIDSVDPFKDIDKIIQKQGEQISRIKAKNCIDMITDIKDREKISEGKKVYWLSPGWLKYWKHIFKTWDHAKSNETFPQNEKAVFLDSIPVFDEYSQSSPEKILEFSDWMAIPIEPYNISLDRLKKLLLECLD
ncbi:MAG: DUF1638 domain-containing protein [Elusimicrobia bacterium]|nr:DUF1638 domain-containing protein [Elusimicrobiota bacterium]